MDRLSASTGAWRFGVAYGGEDQGEVVVRGGTCVASPLARGEIMQSEKAYEATARSSFLTDIAELQRRARRHMDAGAATAGSRASRDTVVKILNEALASELVCVLRYKRHFFMAPGLASADLAAELAGHAGDEQKHADQIADRITQLGGSPNFDPRGLVTRSRTEYVAGAGVIEMLREDLVAERIAIESYAEIIRYLGHDDPATRRLMEEILATEEEHAVDLVQTLSRLESGALDAAQEVMIQVHDVVRGERHRLRGAERMLRVPYDLFHPTGPVKLEGDGLVTYVQAGAATRGRYIECSLADGHEGERVLLRLPADAAGERDWWLCEIEQIDGALV